MRQECSVCAGPHVVAIDALLTSRERGQEAIAAEFGLSQSTISRHLIHCRPELRVGALEASAAPLVGRIGADVTAIEERLDWLEVRLRRALDAIDTLQDYRNVARIARELMRVVEVRVRLLRSREAPPAVVSEAKGAVEALQDLILRALADLPEARARVADALLAAPPSAEVPPTHE